MSTPVPAWTDLDKVAEMIGMSRRWVVRTGKKRGCRFFAPGGNYRGVLDEDIPKLYDIVDPRKVRFG